MSIKFEDIVEFIRRLSYKCTLIILKLQLNTKYIATDSPEADWLCSIPIGMRGTVNGSLAGLSAIKLMHTIPLDSIVVYSSDENWIFSGLITVAVINWNITYICSHLYGHVLTHIRTYVHTHVHAHMHRHTHAQTLHIQMYTLVTYTYMHTHTHALYIDICITITAVTDLVKLSTSQTKQLHTDLLVTSSMVMHNSTDVTWLYTLNVLLFEIFHTRIYS